MSYKSRRWLLLLIFGLTFIVMVPWLYVREPPVASSTETFDRPQATTTNPPPHSGTDAKGSSPSKNATVLTQAPFEIPKLRLDNNQEHWNMRQLSELYSCVAGERRCHPNKRKIILFASPDTKYGLWDGWRRGESIWGEAMFKGFYELGYTVLVIEGWAEAPFLYQLYGSYVELVIGERPGKCIYNRKCIKHTENPDGIPIWKIFDMNYFPKLDWYGTPTDATPLGGSWIITAVDNGPAFPYQYIGYSIEEKCKALHVLPPEERDHRVYILMKQLAYVHFDTSWEADFYSRAADELGIKFVGGYGNDPDFKPGGQDPPAEGWKDIEEPGKIDNLHPLSRENFMKEVGKSKLMLGIGLPTWSPSPYDALCLGVPFLNPVRFFDEADPWNEAKWETQHPEFTRLGPGPPYVYTVHARNYTGFVEAIKQATNTPIDRFIAPHMTLDAFRKRLIDWVETDWKLEALAVGSNWKREAEELHKHQGKTLDVEFLF
ncbi:hypothetical protein BKA70DRAFT_1298766 [Coprinopsis sp. MPI-PUGE-AT-0042]|nr:hypothetical protein BKA70DRAFT_1298766 [Coprinopsis sp. MPI-PUGE-AT-0042]